MPKNKPSFELNRKIILTYLSGKDTYETAIECGCSQTFVMNTLKRQNIPRRTTHSYITKYISNEKFFDIIDTQEKAYVLGILYADGNNFVKGVSSYEVSIALQEEDREILEKIKDLISPTTSLKFINKLRPTHKNQYLLKVNSKIISNQLTNLGCIPNKSLKLTWPKWLIDNLIQHFIRGYFDGDGSLWAKQPTDTGQIDYGFSITSTENFCDFIKEYLANMNIHCTKNIISNGITTTIAVGGNKQVKKVLDWMYQDATIYMQRKYNKYQKFLKYLENRISLHPQNLFHLR